MENEFEYELHVGVKLNGETGRYEPIQVIIITSSQLDIIEMFANKTKDADLNTVYQINAIQFTVMPRTTR